ncbi:MAG: YfhO family protein [Patescibacteria group bacterium]|nr:YfhO family protein [Patescibacteria group bacterium]
MFKGFVDMWQIWFLKKYSDRPLHLFGVGGIFISGLGTMILIPGDYVTPADLKDLAFYTEAAEVTVSDPDGRWIVFSQGYLPNWKAYIDGSETKIYRVDGILMGVFLPPGTHKILFEYDDDLLGMVQHIKDRCFLDTYRIISLLNQKREK